MSLPPAPEVTIPEHDIQYILATSLHAWILEILAYGMYTTVYCVAMHLTLSRTEGPRVKSAVLVTVMWILVTVHTTLTWVLLDWGFIRHAATRETQFVATHFNELRRAVTSFTAAFISILLADVTMIWRCWVLYGRRWIAVFIPALSLAIGTGAQVFRGIAIFTQTQYIPSHTRTISEIIFLSTTVFTNIFCTIAVIYRIISISGLTNSWKTYHGILEILVESAIMYTVVYITRIGLQVYTAHFSEEWDELYVFGQALANVITGVAPTLMIARVAAGHARPDDSWAHSSLPHMSIRSFAESLRFAPASTCTHATTATDISEAV